MTQPEALRMADEIAEMLPKHVTEPVAAELRRLYDLADKYKWQVIDTCARAEKAEAQRDALLEALKSTGLFLHHCWCDVQMNDYSFEKLNQQMAVVDAAIAKAEENT